jgi:hypothetical protein
MQQAANSSQQFAPRLSGPLHTPTQSFSEAPIQTPDSQGGMDWADKQAKEHDAAKSRLSDFRFNISEFLNILLILVSYSRLILPSHTPSYDTD